MLLASNLEGLVTKLFPGLTEGIVIVATEVSIAALTGAVISLVANVVMARRLRKIEREVTKKNGGGNGKQ